MTDTVIPGERRGTAAVLSRIVSYAMHPFLMPLYVMLLLFSTGIIPLYVVPAVRNYLFSVVIVNTILIPAMTIIILRIGRVIPDYSLSTRRDRVIPIFIIALCYGLCVWMLQDIPTIFLLRKCLLAATACVVFAFIVNLFWQVSLHMIAAGGAMGIIFILLYGGFTELFWIMCGAILACGALGSVRLYLGKHDIAQVTVGFFGGFFISILSLLLAS